MGSEGFTALCLSGFLLLHNHGITRRWICAQLPVLITHTTTSFPSPPYHQKKGVSSRTCMRLVMRWWQFLILLLPSRSGTLARIHLADRSPTGRGAFEVFVHFPDEIQCCHHYRLCRHYHPLSSLSVEPTFEFTPSSQVESYFVVSKNRRLINPSKYN